MYFIENHIYQSLKMIGKNESEQRYEWHNELCAVQSFFSKCIFVSFRDWLWGGNASVTHILLFISIKLICKRINRQIFILVDTYSIGNKLITWWRNQMEALSALLALCAGNSPVTGEFSAQGPVTRSFDVLFDLHLNKRLSKQSWGWWFETPWRSLWRQCNVI